jgi:hypothetical protein
MLVKDRVMLSTQILKLLNQPSKKFRSRYIGLYKIIEKISSQAYKLELPPKMKVQPVFRIGLLKHVSSLTPTIEIPDDIPTSTDFVYGADHYHVHSLLDHKIAPRPQSYAKAMPFCFELDGRDMIFWRILGNLTLMLK